MNEKKDFLDISEKQAEFNTVLEDLVIAESSSSSDEVETKIISILPMNFVEVGRVEPNDLKVYIHQNVYKNLEKLSSKNSDKEVGSILIGEMVDYLGKKNLIISEFIEAKYTDSTNASLTFTHDTWEYIHKIRDKKFSDKKIVGWHHTHPNYGIFLSSYDLFIHENFFSLPFQTAYVVDPIQKTRGFFQWQGNKVEKLSGYFVYEEVGKNIEETKVVEEKLIIPINKRIEVSIKVLALIALCTIIALILLVLNNYRLANQLSNFKSSLIAMEALVDRYDERLEDVDQRIKDVNLLLSKVYLSNSASTDNVIRLQLYIVNEGDTLFSIIKKFDIDRAELYQTIVGMNNLIDPDKLYVGQYLLIPIKNEVIE